MEPMHFARTVYLGDRAIKGFSVDCWERTARVQVDVISRIRGETWDFYTAEDIENGLLVFSGVHSLRIEPLGALPDDYIYKFDVEELGQGLFRFLLASSASAGEHAGDPVTVTIVAKDLCLEDPKRPHVQIRE